MIKNNSASRIDNLLELFRRRASCRSYLTREVEEEKIRNCLEAARLAPSACNKQPWRFMIVREPELRRNICESGLLPGISMPWLSAAPVIVVLCADTSLVTHKLAPLLSGVSYQLIDIGIAGEHFVLAAEAQGLGTCWIGWFKESRIRKMLDIPGKMRVLSLISLGYPADVCEQPAKKGIEEISRTC